VVNDHVGPSVEPVPLFATICQKYVVLDASVDGGVYEAAVSELAAGGGGLLVPNRTSYAVAPAALHVKVGDTLLPVDASAGVGPDGAAGAGAVPAVVKLHTGPAAARSAIVFDTICQ
jgi:hypothetical protein